MGSLNRRKALIGGVALVLLVWHALFPVLPSLALIAAVLLAAELLLTVQLDEHRNMRLGSPFIFIAFLTHGAVVAASLQAAAWFIAQLLEGARPRATRRSLPALGAQAAHQLLCGLVGGLAVWLTLGTSPLQPPSERVAALAIYGTGYLVCYVILGLVVTAQPPKQHELPETVEHDAELGMALTFAMGAPVALFILALQSRLGYAVDLLVAFGSLAPLSYSARLYLRLNETALEYSVLHEISRSLSGSVDLNKLYPAIYSRVRQAMPVDVFIIGLLNEEHTELEVPFLVENGELLAPRSVSATETVLDTVIRTGKPLYLTHSAEEAPGLGFDHVGRRAPSTVFVPLCLGDVVIGVLSAQSYTPHAYTPQQIALLDAIARIGAVAINNAGLFAREKEVLRGREEFVSLVAHELKNPLAALLGHAQILDRRLRQFEDKLRRPVSNIQEQGDRMNRLVEDLLDLSRADTGRLVLHLQRVDLGSLTGNVVEQHQILTTQHQIVVVKAEQVPLVQGDASRLTQVLQNLLSNAIKYSPRGGTITIRVEAWAKSASDWPRNLRRTVASAACWVVVRVSDEGIGVPPDQMGRIFDRFYRANNTAQLDVTGTGLGLSVCEGLVRAHGGVIWAESEWGEGSTFTFALPVLGTEPAEFES